MKRLILLLCLSVVIGAVHAQTGRLDLKLPQGHPRYLTTQEGKKETQGFMISFIHICKRKSRKR